MLERISEMNIKEFAFRMKNDFCLDGPDCPFYRECQMPTDGTQQDHCPIVEMTDDFVPVDTVIK